MAYSLLNKWQSSLEVIRVASEAELAVVERAEFCEITFHAIQPDAQFLFHETVKLEIEIPDPFPTIRAMPNLQNLDLWIHKSVKRVDHFTPSLPKLRNLCLNLRELVEFSPIAFDHLVGLEEFCIKVHDTKNYLKQFETSLAPRTLVINGFKLLKLNSIDVGNIENIEANGMVESMLPLRRLESLKFNPDVTTDLFIFFRQFNNLLYLSMGLSDLSQVNRGQLSCLSSVTHIFLKCNESTTEGILLI
jgi:hypothetical protein